MNSICVWQLLNCDYVKEKFMCDHEIKTGDRIRVLVDETAPQCFIELVIRRFLFFTLTCFCTQTCGGGV